MTPKEQQRPTLGAWIGVFAVAVLIAGALYGMWRLLPLGSISAAAVITAGATVLISVFSLIYSRSWEQRRAIEEAQREHKRGVYEDFMTFWFRTLTSIALGEQPPSEKETQRFMADFAHKLILWGSDDFLTQYVQFRSIAATTQEGEASPAVIFGFEQLLYAIRRDLGHSNKDLGRGDLLRVWVNDVDASIIDETPPAA